MEQSCKTTKLFSKPLMKQNIKSNWMLCFIILLIMVMMSVVTVYASSIMTAKATDPEVDKAKVEFSTYLGVMAMSNRMTGMDLSYDKFAAAEDKTMYEAVFSGASRPDHILSVDGLQKTAAILTENDVSIESCILQFEYIYGLGQLEGCFSGEKLDMAGMQQVMMESMGLSSDMLEHMGEMDMGSMFNRMYYTVMGILPIFLLIVILANSLIVDRVDKGSMAYVLSTPTKRSAVSFTQALFLVIAPLIIVGGTCIVRVAASLALLDAVNVGQIVVMYVGMYLLTEAVAGICYLGSCIFNRSKKAMALGGGLTVWFFLASLLGMFGSKDLVSMGMGADALGIFNKLTIVSLFDIETIGTIGSGATDFTFLWKFAILVAIAAVCYAVGAVRFQKKDLPL